MLYSKAKEIVSRCRGDAGSSQRVSQAGDAIGDAIRLWNTRMCWAFTRTTAEDQTLLAEENEILIDGLRRVSSIMMTSPEQRKVQYQPRSFIESNVARVNDTGVISTYDLILQSGKWVIRFWRTPSEDHTFDVTYYQYIPTPVDDDEELDLPNDYILALLDYARYFYLRNFSGEMERAQVYKTDAELGMARALRDDKRHPDYKERHMAAVEAPYPTFQASEAFVEE